MNTDPASGVPISGSHLYEVYSGLGVFNRLFDGTLIASGLGGTTFSASGTLYIGNNGITNGPFTGTIAEILIYNRLLSASEILNVGLYANAKYGIAVANFPEPSTVVLLGIAGLMFWRRRPAQR